MNTKKQTIFLINPLQRIKQHAANIGMARLIGRRNACTPLALPLLAALTPGHYDVRIFDEEIAPIPEGIVPDLVGITAMTPNADRAYEIADRYRAMNVPVIMGGPHVSFNVAEALLHVTSVVAGEAEEIWSTCLADFEAGALKREYRSESPVAFRTSPAPRWDLLDMRKIASVPVQISRGCPYHCEFCVVSEMFGRKMRYREIDDVIAEIRTLPIKTVLFTDDNLTANKEYARTLMARLKPLGIQWVCMASIELGEFPDLLQQMADAGCMHILIGFESLNPASLTEAHKGQNRLERYGAAVTAIHRAGININASFIAGFDNDTLDEYNTIARFIEENNLWYANTNILDVIPGTDLHARITAQGRWSGRPLCFSGGFFPVIHYMNMGQLALFDRHIAAIEEHLAWPRQREMVMRLFSTGWFSRDSRSADVSLWGKITMTVRIIGMFLLSNDPEKKRAFLDLFRLIREKKVGPEKVVFFLLTIEGAHRHFSQMKKSIPQWREVIRGFDKGPWKINNPKFRS